MVPPKLTRVFLQEATDTSTPEFKNWFRNSKVVDESGNPMVVYHATNSAADFEVFRNFANLGHHFGTSQAAADRGKNRLGGKFRIYEVYLSIQHPLFIDDDLLTWETGDIAALVWGAGTPEYDKIQTGADHKSRSASLVKELKRLGYDGIKYTNAVEDPGSVSWIAFDAGQIKSVNNRGTWDRRRGSINE